MSKRGKDWTKDVLIQTAENVCIPGFKSIGLYSIDELTSRSNVKEKLFFKLNFRNEMSIWNDVNFGQDFILGETLMNYI